MRRVSRLRKKEKLLSRPWLDFSSFFCFLSHQLLCCRSFYSKMWWDMSPSPRPVRSSVSYRRRKKDARQESKREGSVGSRGEKEKKIINSSGGTISKQGSRELRGGGGQKKTHNSKNVFFNSDNINVWAPYLWDGNQTMFFFFFGKALIVFEAYCFWFRAGLSYTVWLMCKSFLIQTGWQLQHTQPPRHTHTDTHVLQAHKCTEKKPFTCSINGWSTLAVKIQVMCGGAAVCACDYVHSQAW